MPGGSSPRLVDWIAALPDLGMAAFFLAVWMAPERFGAEMLRYVLLVMLLEFIVVHSAAFMGSVAFGDPQVKAWLRWGRGVGIVGLGLFYSLFIVGFCLGFHTWWPMIAFWTLTANRLLGALIGQGATTEETKKLVMNGWAAGAMSYLAGAFLTTLLPIPRFGVTPAIVSTAAIPSSGLWVEQPWRVVAFGAIYFGLVGWYELNAQKWTKAPAPVTLT